MSDRLLLTRALDHENPSHRAFPVLQQSLRSALTSRAWWHREPPRRRTSVAALRAASRAPEGLDLPMREAGEMRVSRRACSLRRIALSYFAVLLRLPAGESFFSIRCLTFRHPPALSATLDSTRASRVCAGDRDRLHRAPREEHPASAIQKAFPRRAPRPFPSARRTHEQPCSHTQAAPGGAGTSGPSSVTRALT